MSLTNGDTPNRWVWLCGSTGLNNEIADPGDIFPKASGGVGTGYYRELHDAPAGEFSPEDGTLTRTLICRWDQRLAFSQDLLGYANLVGGNITRILPDEHPDAPGFFAANVSFTPLGASRAVLGKDNHDQQTGNSVWNAAKVTVTYRPLPYAVLKDADTIDEFERFIEYKLDSKADYLQLGVNAFRWVSRPPQGPPPTAPPGTQPSKIPLGTTPGIIAPAQTLTLTWHAVPSIAADPFLPPTADRIPVLLGCTNDDYFLDWLPKGTVLFTAAQAFPILPRFGGNLPGGKRHWRIEYTFEVRDRGVATTTSTTGSNVTERAGVNWLYDPANMRYDLVTIDGDPGGQRMYRAKNLDRLFDLAVYP